MKGFRCTSSALAYLDIGFCQRHFQPRASQPKKFRSHDRQASMTEKRPGVGSITTSPALDAAAINAPCSPTGLACVCPFRRAASAQTSGMARILRTPLAMRGSCCDTTRYSQRHRVRWPMPILPLSQVNRSAIAKRVPASHAENPAQRWNLSIHKNRRPLGMRAVSIPCLNSPMSASGAFARSHQVMPLPSSRTQACPARRGTAGRRTRPERCRSATCPATQPVDLHAAVGRQAARNVDLGRLHLAVLGKHTGGRGVRGRKFHMTGAPTYRANPLRVMRWPANPQARRAQRDPWHADGPSDMGVNLHAPKPACGREGGHARIGNRAVPCRPFSCGASG